MHCTCIIEQAILEYSLILCRDNIRILCFSVVGLVECISSYCFVLSFRFDYRAPSLVCFW